jgi:hypothetical protein
LRGIARSLSKIFQSKIRSWIKSCIVPFVFISKRTSTLNWVEVFFYKAIARFLTTSPAFTLRSKNQSMYELLLAPVNKLKDFCPYSKLLFELQ